MPDLSPPARTVIRRAAVLAAISLLPTPAAAQYIGTAPPPPLPAPLRPGEVETPTAALGRAVRTLAQAPRDFPALINAGRAALDLGDTQAAIGFFGRAEEVRPTDPAPKIGMGAATVAGGDARGSLTWFAQAQQLGASGALLGADRGLAQDLLGNQAAAQADYRAALSGPEADEARRRLALSLGISGDREGAFATLQPLLMRRDAAAQRIRAFVLALVGDERGASGAIDSAMPGTGTRMASFFRLLPTLSAEQKAAAVHLGVFPDPAQIRVASAAPPRFAPPVAEQQVALARPAPARRAKKKSAGGMTVTYVPITPPPALAQPVAPAVAITVAATPAATVPLPPPIAPVSVAAAAPVPAAPAPSFRVDPPPVAVVAAPETNVAAAPASVGDRLSGIDRLLAQVDDSAVPPAPRPQFEYHAPPAPRPIVEAPVKLASADLAKTRKAAEAKKSADARKAAEAKQAADDKAEREAIGVAGANWVQLAGGAHADRMESEFRRLSAKSSALRKKGGAVTGGKDYFRLLTGPFSSRGDAQEFVNQLAKDGVDGFSWTRTPATLKIEKIPPK